MMLFKLMYSRTIPLPCSTANYSTLRVNNVKPDYIDFSISGVVLVKKVNFRQQNISDFDVIDALNAQQQNILTYFSSSQMEETQVERLECRS